MEFADVLDAYTWEARLQPALLTLFPLFVTMAVWTPALYGLAGGLVGLAIACGAVVYLAHIARERGRRVEGRLFVAWGGKSTIRWLRHRDDALDRHTKSRYHEYFARNVPGWRAPTPEDEAADPDRSDALYDSAVRWLREQTRDRKRFALIFKENVSYGFRRNLFGLRPLGLAVAGLCVVGNGAVLYYELAGDETSISVTGVASLVVSVLATAGWTFVVKPSWVRDAAEAYARALLSSCDA